MCGMASTFRYVLLAFVACLSVCLPGRAAAFAVNGPEAASYVVVIDAGHGGDDKGAIGPDGIEEKDVTLSLAMKLADTLRTSGFHVLLTRTGDVFIPLEERTAFANRNGADLFISIHANAAVSRDANGIETFFLNFESTDEDARRVAAFENNAPLMVRNASDEDGDLKDILLDLENTEAHHESSRLAEAVHTSMLRFSADSENRGIKQAPFTVLVGATMPAILVEAGFISNPREEKRLAAKKWQEKIAASIAEGILGYKKSFDGGGSFVGVKESVHKN